MKALPFKPGDFIIRRRFDPAWVWAGFSDGSLILEIGPHNRLPGETSVKLLASDGRVWCGMLNPHLWQLMDL
jgi:hypothetical protein